MNVRRINAAARVILAAQKTGTSLAAPLAMALEADQFLQFPEAAAELDMYRALQLGTPEGRVSATCADATHPVWLRELDDMRGCPWCRIAELEKTTPPGAEVTAAAPTARTVVLTALSRALREQPTAGRILDGLDELGEAVFCEDPAGARSWVDGISLLAGLPTAPDTGLTYYRASHESIVIGRYTTEAVARRRCETLLSDEHPDNTPLIFDWIGDESEPEDPWELTVQINGGDEQPTGYVVHPLRIEAEFDPDTDW